MGQTMLDCVVCGGRKWMILEGMPADELVSTGATRMNCDSCKRDTYWKVADYGRRAGSDRRTQHDELKPQTVELVPGSQRISLQGPPDRERYMQTATQILQSERRMLPDRRQAFQRAHNRVPLRLPIRIRVSGMGLRFEEVTSTINVSRTGVYFESTGPYSKGLTAYIAVNFSATNPGANIEQLGTVVRIDPNPSAGTKGVAIHLS
jgi:hypothetical protein